MQKVGIVILNYKVADLAIKCIKSVQESLYKNIDIVVVDNNSNDGSDEKLSQISGINFIETGENLGYTGGNNIGIKKALELGSEYVFILNSDTFIEKNTINNLVKCAEDLEAGVVGPKIYFNDKKTIWYAGGMIDLNNILGIHRGVDEIDRGQYETIGETEFVSGAAMLVKKDVFDKVGFFNERYFLYLEDLEFCYRSKVKGTKIVYNPKALMYHENAKSTGLGSALQDYFITRNRLLFAFKYLPWRKRLALLKHIILTLKYSTRRLALFDFLIGNLGKGSFLK